MSQMRNLKVMMVGDKEISWRKKEITTRKTEREGDLKTTIRKNL